MNDAFHNFAAGLYFEPYAIDQLVDASRHHHLPLDPEFPFAIKAFCYETFVPGERLTWHNRLEIFCPTHGSGHFQMGERVLDFESGDLRKLAMLAVPLGVRIAYEALSWGRTINEFHEAWDIVCSANAPNLGVGIDSFHIIATKTPLDKLDALDPKKIFLVQLADFMWNEIRSVEERIATARHFRVFPGEGAHSDQVAELVMRLDKLGYSGDYSFEVFNDDYQQMPMERVCARAFRAAEWLGKDVLRRSAPLPNQMRLKSFKQASE